MNHSVRVWSLHCKLRLVGLLLRFVSIIRRTSIPWRRRRGTLCEMECHGRMRARAIFLCFGGEYGWPRCSNGGGGGGSRLLLLLLLLSGW